MLFCHARTRRTMVRALCHEDRLYGKTILISGQPEYQLRLMEETALTRLLQALPSLTSLVLLANVFIFIHVPATRRWINGEPFRWSDTESAAA
jgi:hypothetical protein